MNIEDLREYCLQFSFVTEETPFGADILVYKVHGKMFALIPLDTETLQITLKNLPDKNIFLKENYAFIEGAYHFNKKHWITLIGVSANSQLCKQLIKESYYLVWNKLPKRVKENI